MFPDVAPSVHEEIAIRLQLGEFDSVVGLEAMPQVGTAVAHQLHLAFVFGIPGDELHPIVPERQLPHGPVVATGAVVGEEGSRLDPAGKAFRHHRASRGAELVGEEVAESPARGIEGDLHVGVLGDPSGVGGPHPVDEARGSDRGEAHLIDPDVAGKPRCRRPFPRRVETAVDPILGGLHVDPRDLGDHPIGAVQRYQRQYRPYLRRRQLRRRQRGGGGVGIMAMAFRAFVAPDPVLPPPVPHEGDPAFGAPRVPFVPLRKLGLLEPGPLPFPAIRLGSEQRQGGRQFGVAHG